MSNKIPWGVKLIAAVLLLTGAYGLLGVFIFLSKNVTISQTPYASGRILGIVMARLVKIVINLTAGIGLFKQRKWGLKFATAALILGGLSYARGFARGFSESLTGSFSPSLPILLVSFIFAAVIVYLLARYLNQKKTTGKFT